MQLRQVVKRALRPFVTPRIKSACNFLRGIERDPLSHERIAQLVGKPDPTILEIGCNDGADTLRFLQVMPQATIYCFEPDNRAATRFREKVGDQPKVHLFEMAISDRNGTVEFHTSSFDQSGSIRAPKSHLWEHPWVTFENIVKVQSRRLDDWCRENRIDHIDFIWMDAQGAEADIASGAGNILQTTRFIYTEYSNNETYAGQPSLRQFRRLLPDFEVLARYPGDVLLRNGNIVR